MIQNRTIPYGYKIEMGELQVNISESDVIKLIYSEYANGMSYKKIADMLNLKGVKYIESKPLWNKNMVARILKNEKYLGAEIYPKIIDSVTKQNASFAQKTYTHTQAKEIKYIKPLLKCAKCGGKVNRRFKDGTERWYCENDSEHIATSIKDETIIEELVNFITTKLKDYELIQNITQITSIDIISLQNKIDRDLEQEEIDVGQIQTDIKTLANLKYKMCKNTMHLKQYSLDKLVENSIENLNHIKNIIEEINIGKYKIESFKLTDENIINT